jgi:hypothetical protein
MRILLINTIALLVTTSGMAQLMPSQILLFDAATKCDKIQFDKTLKNRVLHQDQKIPQQWYFAAPDIVVKTPSKKYEFSINYWSGEEYNKRPNCHKLVADSWVPPAQCFPLVARYDDQYTKYNSIGDPVEVRCLDHAGLYASYSYWYWPSEFYFRLIRNSTGQIIQGLRISPIVLQKNFSIP